MKIQIIIIIIIVIIIIIITIIIIIVINIMMIKMIRFQSTLLGFRAFSQKIPPPPPSPFQSGDYDGNDDDNLIDNDKVNHKT